MPHTLKLDHNGNFVLNEKYQEIKRLWMMLTEAEIPHSFERVFDGWQICYPTAKLNQRILSAIEHFGSYGKDEDLIEIMTFIPEEGHDSVRGFLSAEDVFNRIKTHYDETHPKDPQLVEGRRCAKCGSPVYKSITPGIPLRCLECNENRFVFETVREESR